MRGGFRGTGQIQRLELMARDFVWLRPEIVRRLFASFTLERPRNSGLVECVKQVLVRVVFRSRPTVGVPYQ